VALLLSIAIIGCGGGSAAPVSQAPALYTLSETTFDQNEDIMEVTSTSASENEEIANDLENALLSRHWIFFGTGLNVEDSSLGNSLRITDIPETELDEYSGMFESYGGKVNVGAVVIGNRLAPRVKFAGIQGYSQITTEWKTYSMRLSAQDLPDGEGGMMMLVFGLEGAKGVALSPAMEIPNSNLIISFQVRESVEGNMVIDNILVQADQPAPNVLDCPELLDVFDIVRDLVEEQEENGENLGNTTSP